MVVKQFYLVDSATSEIRLATAVRTKTAMRALHREKDRPLIAISSRALRKALKEGWL